MNHCTLLAAVLFSLGIPSVFAQTRIVTAVAFGNNTIQEIGGNNATTCTITLNATAPSPVTVYIGASDPNEINFPSNVTVATGNATATFAVAAVADAVFDYNASIYLGATTVATEDPYNNAQYISDTPLSVINAENPPAPSSLVISQYYDGTTSADNYIEISNISNSTVLLEDYLIAVYKGDNTNSEGWKYDNAAPTESFQFDNSYSLEPNATLLLKTDGAATPAYAAANATIMGAIEFSGDDTVVLYTNGGYSSADSILDAVSFTSTAGGQNTAFIRLTNNSAGYDLQPGSDVSYYPGVWQEVALSAVNSANSTTSEYLGFYQSGGAADPNTFAGYMALNNLTGPNATTTANPDGDAFNNLYEYAFDLNPTVKEYGRLLGYTNQTAGNYSITLAFTRDADKTDLDYTVKRSASPTFTASTIIADSTNGNATVAGSNTTVSESPQAGNKYNVNVTYNGSTSADPRQFFTVQPSL
jgi:hypothetical protein